MKRKIKRKIKTLQNRKEKHDQNYLPELSVIVLGLLNSCSCWICCVSGTIIEVLHDGVVDVDGIGGGFSGGTTITTSPS